MLSGRECHLWTSARRSEIRKEPPLTQRGLFSLLKSLAEFRRPETAKRNQIVFPAACTSEKHFSRSERRIVRFQRTTKAQSAALFSSKKWQGHFFDTQKRKGRSPSFF